jgi:hypothetical protein
VLLLVGVIAASLFRLTSNLLVVWPFAWAAASSMGTLMGDMLFSWRQVGIWSVILLMQLGFIAVTWWRRARTASGGMARGRR